MKPLCTKAFGRYRLSRHEKHAYRSMLIYGLFFCLPYRVRQMNGTRLGPPKQSSGGQQDLPLPVRQTPLRHIDARSGHPSLARKSAPGFPPHASRSCRARCVETSTRSHEGDAAKTSRQCQANPHDRPRHAHRGIARKRCRPHWAAGNMAEVQSVTQWSSFSTSSSYAFASSSSSSSARSLGRTRKIQPAP